MKGVMGNVLFIRLNQNKKKKKLPQSCQRKWTWRKQSRIEGGDCVKSKEIK